MRVTIASDIQHVAGTLDTQHPVGRGTIIEYVVIHTLHDCTKTSFNYCYDVYSQKYGTINVKSSSRHKSNVNSTWNFRKTPTSYTPDYYICVGLNEDFNKILHVWAIPGNAKIVVSTGINITDSKQGLKRANEYELDHYPYETTFQTINIESLPEFSNINTENFKKYQTIAKCVVKGYSPMDLIDEYGIECYEEYLYWVKKSKLQKCFNVFNGSIGIYSNGRGMSGDFPTDCFVDISESTYPLYDYTWKFIGYQRNGMFIKPMVKPSEHQSKQKTILYIIKLYTAKYGKISIDDLKRELEERKIDVDNLEMALRKFMQRGDLLRKSPTEYFSV